MSTPEDDHLREFALKQIVDQIKQEYDKHKWKLPSEEVLHEMAVQCHDYTPFLT